MENRYLQRGVSADKEDVHNAIKSMDKGLFPNAFCRIYPDMFSHKLDYCTIMHADGAGTKSILAYLYWKETGDSSVWKGIAQDALVMNTDDMLCVGATNHFAYTSTIGRNKNNIPGEIISQLIEGTQTFIDNMKKHDIHITLMGGETADVGDVVKTILVDGTMCCNLKKKDVIHATSIKAGNVIVSLASDGQATYESEYNSGIGSNGLTSARHDILSDYYLNFPETFDANIDKQFIYTGKYRLTDASNTPLNMGKMLLSPTRTYLPIMKEILENHRSEIQGIIHCSGGGQTKCLHYVSDSVSIIKNNLLSTPILFNIIQASSNTSWREMYKVFNMGARLEIYTNEKTALEIISIAKKFSIHAQISGFVEAADKKKLTIHSPHGEFVYQ